jgi:hypothetical protein
MSQVEQGLTTLMMLSFGYRTFGGRNEWQLSSTLCLWLDGALDLLHSRP